MSTQATSGLTCMAPLWGTSCNERGVDSPCSNCRVWKAMTVQHQPLDTLNVHDLAELRKIIAEVIDEGIPQTGDFDEDRVAPWGTYDGGFGGWTTSDKHGLADDEARAMKEQFIEAVIAKVIATAAPSLREETN